MKALNIRVSPNIKQAGTHIPMLLNVIPKTTGDVCELGSGTSSTPLLHWLCQGRKLVTYENDPEYLNFAKKFVTYNHRVRNLDHIDFERHWSVVFVDHSTPRERDANGKRIWQRGDDVLKFKNVDIFILHDTEEWDLYNYDRLPEFKYRLDWKETKPWTSTVSNVIDVSKWT